MLRGLKVIGRQVRVSRANAKGKWHYLQVSDSAAFHTTALKLKATPFGMPAMSPTMEEGGIVSWKVKEGDKFSSGDVLLEVETDKATIDVEAQDDGIVAKLLKHDGDKEIKVGTPIAFLADPEDDLATLKLPEIEAESKPEPKQTEKPAPPPEPKAQPQSKPAQSTSSATKTDPNQVLFPSVELLLHLKGISKEEALAKIPATGPKGRILKGDVLAYLGEIDASSNSKIASYIESKSHLDLSNIELRAPIAQDKKPVKTEKPKKEPVVVTYNYNVLEDITVGDVREMLQKAEQYAYRKSVSPPSDLTDPLFEDLVAPPRNAERFTISTSVDELLKRNDAETDFEDVDDLEVKLTLTDVVDAKDRAELFNEELNRLLFYVEVHLPLFNIMSTNHIDFHLVHELATQVPAVFPSYGIHPWYTHLFSTDRVVDEFGKRRHYQTVLHPAPSEILLTNLPMPIFLNDHIATIERYLQEGGAIGEIGLDKSFRVPNSGFFGPFENQGLSSSRVTISHQLTILNMFLELAEKLQRPISVHCVGCHGKLLDQIRQSITSPNLISLHSFSGSLDQIKLWKKYYPEIRFSISKVLNIEKYKPTLDKSLAVLNESNLMLETDLSLDSLFLNNTSSHLELLEETFEQLREVSPTLSLETMTATFEKCLGPQ